VQEIFWTVLMNNAVGSAAKASICQAPIDMLQSDSDKHS
jgi:hypothetical protein